MAPLCAALGRVLAIVLLLALCFEPGAGATQTPFSPREAIGSMGGPLAQIARSPSVQDGLAALASAGGKIQSQMACVLPPTLEKASSFVSHVKDTLPTLKKSLRLNGGAGDPVRVDRQAAEITLVYAPLSNGYSADTDFAKWTVAVVGSWSNWLDRHAAEWNEKAKVFEVRVAVPLASHEFKFVVNDAWVTSADYKEEANVLGSNNIITAEETDELSEPDTHAAAGNKGSLSRTRKWAQKAEEYVKTAATYILKEEEKKSIEQVVAELQADLAALRDGLSKQHEIESTVRERLQQEEARKAQLASQLTQEVLASGGVEDLPMHEAILRVADAAAALTDCRVQVDTLNKQLEAVTTAAATTSKLQELGSADPKAAAAAAAAAREAQKEAQTLQKKAEDLGRRRGKELVDEALKKKEEEVRALKAKASAAVKARKEEEAAAKLRQAAGAKAAAAEAAAAAAAAKAAADAEARAAAVQAASTGGASAPVAQAAGARAAVQMCGVGMTLEAGSEASGGCCVVRGMKKGGPVDLCDRIHVGDRLVRVNDVSCVGVTREAIKEFVIGPVGSQVELLFERHHGDGNTETIAVNLRRTLPTPAPAAAAAARNGAAPPRRRAQPAPSLRAMLAPVEKTLEDAARTVHALAATTLAAPLVMWPWVSSQKDALLHAADARLPGNWREQMGTGLRMAVPVAVIAGAAFNDPLKSQRVRPGALKQRYKQVTREAKVPPPGNAARWALADRR